MSVPAVDMSHPANVAAVAMRAENAVQLLQSQVKSSMDNVVSRLDAMHADNRDNAKIVGALVTSIHDLQGNSVGLNRVSALIERYHSEGMETTQRLTAENETRWAKHEEANRCVADRVTTFRGVLIGFGVLIAMLVAAVTYNLEARFGATDERVRHEARLTTDRIESHAAYSAQEKEVMKVNIAILRSDVNEMQKLRGLK